MDAINTVSLMEDVENRSRIPGIGQIESPAGPEDPGKTGRDNKRRMEVKKIFVGGISWGTDDAELGEAFSDCGEVVSAKVIREKETNKSRGFGFVEFTTDEAAAKAKKKDGQKIDGRVVRVSDAQEKSGNGRRSERTRD